MGKNKSRDDLITMVQRGEMTPADAESQVKLLGLGPLASEPNPNDYDPMREPFWTLPMAVAWIAYRSLNAVRACWDDYRKECWDWHYREWRVGPDGFVHQGHFLEQRSKSTLVRLKMAEACPGQAGLMSVEEAIDALWLAVRSASLEVTGIDEDSGRRLPIPAQQWHDLTWFEEKGRDVIRADPRHGRNTARYVNVIVPAGAVRERWPARLETTALLKTGAPGRPTSFHLVEAEFETRCARNEVEASLAKEAEVLAAWLRKTHPNYPRLTPKTIKNKLRAAYRQHKEARN